MIKSFFVDLIDFEKKIKSKYGNVEHVISTRANVQYTFESLSEGPTVFDSLPTSKETEKKDTDGDTNNYVNTYTDYTSFSGTDTVVYFDGKMEGSLQSISYAYAPNWKVPKCKMDKALINYGMNTSIAITQVVFDKECKTPRNIDCVLEVFSNEYGKSMYSSFYDLENLITTSGMTLDQLGVRKYSLYAGKMGIEYKQLPTLKELKNISLESVIQTIRKYKMESSTGIKELIKESEEKGYPVVPLVAVAMELRRVNDPNRHPAPQRGELW